MIHAIYRKKNFLGTELNERQFEIPGHELNWDQIDVIAAKQFECGGWVRVATWLSNKIPTTNPVKQ